MVKAERIRVLIVDDSALIRMLLTDMLGSVPDIEVVGAARDGDEALALAAKLLPDVITLDVQMPGKSGIEILPALFAIKPFPVLMLSTLTQEGAEVTLNALELGAVDYMAKPERQQLAELRSSADLLLGKIRMALVSKVRKPRRSPQPALGVAVKDQATQSATRPGGSTAATKQVVVIGISTGGPQTLSDIFPSVVPPVPPILIVQHMPANFTSAFAQRLNRSSLLTIKEAEEGDAILPGRVLIAPGGRHMSIVTTRQYPTIALGDGPSVSGHKPSIDVLFHSAAKVFGGGAIGLIMTGMGRDGVDGCKAILAAGGETYGQDEASSVVYGMNKAAFVENAVKSQIAPDEVPGLLRMLGRRA